MKSKALTLLTVGAVLCLTSAAVGGVNIGSPAPDFTLTDVYGQLHSLSDYQGRVVLLNFWQST